MRELVNKYKTKYGDEPLIVSGETVVVPVWLVMYLSHHGGARTKKRRRLKKFVKSKIQKLLIEASKR